MNQALLCPIPPRLCHLCSRTGGSSASRLDAPASACRLPKKVRIRHVRLPFASRLARVFPNPHGVATTNIFPWIFCPLSATTIMPASKESPRRTSRHALASQAAGEENTSVAANRYVVLDHQERENVAKNLRGNLEKTKETVLPRINAISNPTDGFLGEEFGLLRKTNLYSKHHRRWTHIPEGPRGKSHLRSAIKAIFAAVLSNLTNMSTHTDGSTRTIVETVNTPLAHKPFSDGGWSSPDLAVLATGPSFELQQKGSFGYTNIATCILLVTEEGKKCQGSEGLVFQLGVFAK